MKTQSKILIMFLFVLSIIAPRLVSGQIDFTVSNTGIKWNSEEGLSSGYTISTPSLNINASYLCAQDGTKIIRLDSSGVWKLHTVNGDTTFTYQEFQDTLAYFGFGTNNVSQSIDVNVQDQTSPLIIGKMSVETGSTTLVTSPAIDDYTFKIASPTGFANDQYLSIFSVADNRFYLATIIDMNLSDSVVTVDTPLDFAFPIGSFVTAGNTDMSVNGSVTPVIYGLRNTEEAIGESFDITRIIFKCLTNTALDLSDFGDIAGGLTNGIVFRQNDGVYYNVFNAKTNGDLKGIMFDFDIELAQGAAQDGFTGRMTFAGQNKMGVAIRLNPGEDIQIIIQDDLSSLVLFEIIAEGHTVVNN